MQTQTFTPSLRQQIAAVASRMTPSPAGTTPPGLRERDIINLSYGVRPDNPELVPHQRVIITKLTQGETVIDSRMDEHWAWMPSRADLLGGFHFYVPGESPQVQASHFINTALTLSPRPDFLVADFDVPVGSGEAETFMGYLLMKWASEFGKTNRLWVYSNWNIYKNFMGRPDWVKEFLFWFAYPVDGFLIQPLDPPYVDPGEWDGWQYLWKYYLPGLAGSTNRTQWDGDWAKCYQDITDEPLPVNDLAAEMARLRLAINGEMDQTERNLGLQ